MLKIVHKGGADSACREGDLAERPHEADFQALRIPRSLPPVKAK